jgi:putative phosphoribosyl transferase
LAAELGAYAGRADVLVLGLPRGGIPVAYEVALRLDVSLDVFVVRKLGVPGHEELAMGAIASGGVRVLNDEVVRGFGLPVETIETVAERERHELERRERAYRGDRAPHAVNGMTTILIDDGLATGATMRAAAAALRRQGPARLVVAVPTAAPETCEAFRDELDEIVCATTPEPFYSVGLWYEDFSETTDDEVRDLLRQARPGAPPRGVSHGDARSGRPPDAGPAFTVWRTESSRSLQTGAARASATGPRRRRGPRRRTGAR